MIYWGLENTGTGEEQKAKNNLICASWDRNLYVFDDNDPQAREGQYRYTLAGRKQNSRLNYVDFWPDQKTTATASDDGYVNI